MREVWGGVVIALRRWPTMLALSDVLTQVAVLKGGRELREREAVTFTAFYPPGLHSDVDEGAVRFLTDMIDRQEAYTFIVQNMIINDPRFDPSDRPLVLFGDVVPDVFPGLQLPDAVPSAMLGARRADQNISSVPVAGASIPVVGTLPEGATFFDVGLGGVALDNHIVIRAPTRMLASLHAIEEERITLDEALMNAVMFAPADEVVDAYVSGYAKGGMFLVPQDVAGEQPQGLRNIMMTSAMYIVGMLGFLALALAAFVSSARMTMRQELRAFKIRAMCGATAGRISLRVGGFLGAVVLAPPVAWLSPIVMMGVAIGGLFATAALSVMVGVVVVFVCLWVTSVRGVLAQGGMGRSA